MEFLLYKDQNGKNDFLFRFKVDGIEVKIEDTFVHLVKFLDGKRFTLGDFYIDEDNQLVGHQSGCFFIIPLNCFIKDISSIFYGKDISEYFVRQLQPKYQIPSMLDSWRFED